MRSKLYLFHLALPILAAMLLTTCTLSMEDYVIPEEEKGFDEPVVVKNDFGTITYQYNEGVQSLTPNIQDDYLVYVEDDSILYFMDSTPERYVPKVGGLIAATCTPKIPLGLESRVLSVTQQDGMYRVVTSRTTRNEIYKDLDVKIELDYLVPERAVYDSLELAQKGVDIKDLEQIDMTFIDEYYGVPEKARSPRYISRARRATRAGDEKEKDDIITDKTETKTINHNITLDYPLGNDKSFKATVGFTDVTTQHYYYEEHKKQDYRKEYTIRSSQSTLSLRLAGEKIFKQAKNDGDLIVGRDLREAYQNFKRYCSAPGSKLKAIVKPFEIVGIKVPLPGTSFFFVINFEAKISLSGEFYGEGAVTITQPKTLMGYEYSNGSKRELKQTLEPASLYFSKAAIGGSATVQATVSAGIGAEHASGFGATINAGITVGATYNFELGYKGNGTSHCADVTSKATVFIDFNVFAKVYFSPAGISLFNCDVDIWKKRLYSKDTNFLPVIDRHESNFKREIIRPKEGVSLWQYTVNYAFKSLWPLDNIFGHKEHTFPRLRVYYGSLEGSYREFKSAAEIGAAQIPMLKYASTIDVDRTFSFVFNDNDVDPTASSLICVPVLYDDMDDTYTVLTSVKWTYEKRNPKVTVVKGTARVRNDKASKFMDAEEFEERTGRSGSTIDQYNRYEFWNTFKFQQTENIQKWGVFVQIVDASDKPVYDLKKLIYSKDEVNDPEVYSNGYVEPGNKTVMLNFFTTFAPKQVSEAWSCRMRIYTVDVQGNEKSYPWTNWIRLDCPYDNISNMSKKQQNDLGEGFDADL